MYVYARKVVKNNNDDALRFFFYQMSECSPEMSEEYEVAQLFFNPLCSDAVRVQFLPTFNRMVHSEEAVETDIGAVFALRKQKNPTLFDGSKFRFHSCTSSSGDAASAGGAGSEVAVLSLGLTSYGTFLGTKRPPSGAKPFKKTSLNEKIFSLFLVLIYSIPFISTEF